MITTGELVLILLGGVAFYAALDWYIWQRSK
jgi:hypothetical protein